MNLGYLEEVYNRKRNELLTNDSNKDQKSKSKQSRSRPKSAPIQKHRNKNTKRRHKITIPEPFAFDERDKKSNHDLSQTKSISKRKFEEYMDDLKREEDYHLNFQFKANPVPLSAVTRKLKNVHGLKGKKYVKQSKNESSDTIIHEFTAKKVPWYVKVKLYDAMMEEQNTKRKDRIRWRAQKLLSKSSLPPRMQLYETKENIKLKKQKMLKIKKEHYKEYTFHPKITHNVPNFEKLRIFYSFYIS